MSSALYFIRIAVAALLVAVVVVAAAVAAEPAALVVRAIGRARWRRNSPISPRCPSSEEHRHWDPQESISLISATGSAASQVHVVDGYRARSGPIDWVRFRIAPMKRTFIYSEVFADGVGYVLSEDNIVLSRQAKETNPSLHTMSASRVIANRREQHRMSPRLLLDMRDAP